ncbi:MAG: nucleotide exchange factor GrpE [Bacteroidales bacterium]
MSLKNEHKDSKRTHNTENEEVKQNETPQSEENVEGQENAAELSESDKVAAELADLKLKYADLSNSHLRLMAEFDNYRKRTLKEKSDLIKNGGESTLVRILPVVDDFERAMSVLENATDMQAVVDGIGLIYTKFSDFLKQSNVTAIETENAAFDTEYHEAITTIPAPSEELKGKIIDCVQKGYLLNEKVIRFAKVVVGE